MWRTIERREYNPYIHSQAWQERTRNERWGKKCEEEGCYKWAEQCHHLDYSGAQTDGRGNFRSMESTADLECLCKEHHKQRHIKLGDIEETLREFFRQHPKQCEEISQQKPRGIEITTYDESISPEDMAKFEKMIDEQLL